MWPKTSPGRLYSPSFYARQDRSGSAAAVIEALHAVIPKPESVVDFGCGTGSWLRAFQRAGTGDVCGVEGPWVEKCELEIDRAAVVLADLSRPIRLGRRFDLAVSLEVAEHLPASAAEDFVLSLTTASDVVLFSAAVPGQGGQGHVNEQWPEYWVQIFGRLGFEAYDVIRPRIWTDRRVSFWYRQNTILFVDRKVAARMSLGQAGARALVHPELFENLGIRRSVAALKKALRRRFFG